MNVLLEIRGATFRFGRRTVFSALDLDVHAGEVMTLLGPNGCGKSTLLRCIGGLLALEGGSMRLANLDLSTLDVGARAREVGLLLQEHTPSFPFQVLDVVSMGRSPHLKAFGEPSSQDLVQAEQALDAVGVRHLKHRPYTELSGGERQLVLLARTLVQQPNLILLDEPTAHLDLKNQVRLVNQIRHLAAQGVTMMVSTHDANHAFLLPGRVALMQANGTLLVGAAEEVLTDAALSAAYGVDIAVLPIRHRSSGHAFKHCTPWYS